MTKHLLLLMAGLLTLATQSPAAPIQPVDDQQVIERLPPRSRTSASTDPAVAAREAQALLSASRQQADPRLAGRALARLLTWQADAQAPAEVVLALADAEQYLHQFDSATARLQALVTRQPQRPQAWLMLATLHRLAGRLDPSDQACQALQRQAVQPHAAACLAENAALRGDAAGARAKLMALVNSTPAPATRAWLLTTLAELEQRAGRPAAADAAWQQALQLAPDDGYARLGYADFLLDQKRPGQAFMLLQGQLASDPVLLRQAIAARRAQRPEATTLHQQLRDRFAQADLRPESGGHERERALAALDLDDQPAAALALAQKNVQHQREPIDLWLLARSARAAGQPEALAQARQLAASIPLKDSRLDTP